MPEEIAATVITRVAPGVEAGMGGSLVGSRAGVGASVGGTEVGVGVSLAGSGDVAGSDDAGTILVEAVV